MKKGVLKILILFTLFLSINVYADADNDMTVMVRPSPEKHLVNGLIEYIYHGINSGPELWGTTKFQMSIDGGETWFYAYCLNNDLNTPEDLLNKELTDYEAFFNNPNIKKILYYGYNDDTWDKEGYDYVRRHSYYIWMPLYNEKGQVVGWDENWTDDLAYILTHLALSYAYYHDVYGLSDEESYERAFYGVEENESDAYTKARSVAKLWYEYLISKPDLGIKIHLKNDTTIDAYRINTEKTLNTNFNDKITVEGEKISSDVGGRLEFTVPEDMMCIVEGESEDASKPGSYKAGSKVTIGAGQNFSFKLAKATKEIENLTVDFYENYNIIRIKGGKDEEGKELQDIAGVYKSKSDAQTLNFNFEGGMGKVTITKKAIGGHQDKYYVGIFNDDNTLFDVVELSLEEKGETTASFFLPLKLEGETKYFIRETDKEGTPLENTENMNISIDNQEIVFKSDNTEKQVNITNYYLEPSPKTGIGTPVYLILLSILGVGVFVIVNKKFIRNFRKTF